MPTVAEILRSKGDFHVHSLPPDASVLDALKLMADRNIGALLVMEDDQIVGIFSERDYARKIALMSRSSRDTPLRDIMTSAVRFVRPDNTGEQCMAMMTQGRLRHLPVLDGERLVGLISIGDLVKSIISHQQFIIEQLEQYISGEHFSTAHAR